MTSGEGEAQPKKRRRWLSLRSWRLWIILLVLFYTAAGFLLLPWIVKRELVSFVEHDLGRRASVESVRFNPFTFTFSLAGLSTTEADGTALLDLGELYVDFEASSITQPAWTFSQIRLSRPQINFARFTDGETNFGRILEALASGEEPEAEPEPAGEPVPLLIRKFNLEEGAVDVDDRGVRPAFKTRLGPASLELSDFGTLPDRSGQTRFSVVTESGASIDWTGTVSVNPLHSAGHLSAQGERLRLLWRYLQDRVGFEIADGKGTLDLDYELAMKDAMHFSMHDLKLVVESVSIKPKGGDTEVLRLPRLTATGGRLEWPEQSAHLDEIKVTGLSLDAWRDEQGTINLLAMLEPGEQDSSSPPAKKRPAAEAAAGPPADASAEPNPAEATAQAEAAADEEEVAPPAEAAAGKQEPAEAPAGSDAAPKADTALETEGLQEEKPPQAEPEPVVADSAAAPEKPAAAASASDDAAAPKSDAPESRPPSKAKRDAAPPWKVGLGRLLIEDFALAFEDRNPKAPLQSGVENLRLELRDVSNEPGAQFDLDFSTDVKTGGHIACKGKLGIDPLAVDTQLEVKDLSVLPAEPFLHQVARLDLESAALSVAGEVRSGGEETLAFDGTVGLTDLSTKDTMTNERFLAWKALTLSKLAVRLDGRTIEAAQLKLDAPYARVLIAKDGSTNVAAVLRADDASAAGDSAPEVEPGTPEESAGSKPFVVDIRKVTVHEGSANFADLSLPLPFDTGIHSLKGQISPVRSNDNKPAKIDLHGSVGEYGEANVGGKVDLFAPESNADVVVAFRNLEMTKFTPYSAKFAGYRIEQGKLAVELEYRLENRKLQAKNKIVLDKFELGDEVESPDAIDVPLRLAVALLKDSDGRINVDVPVSGSLDDPQFAYGKAVRDAFKTMLVRAVKAPFSALGALVGAGDEHLDYVLFTPGEADIAPPEREKLSKLADALQERPKLSLDVRGRYAREVDEEGLRRAKVEAVVTERTADDADLTRRAALEDLFLDSFSRTELANLESANTRMVEPAIATGSSGPQPRLDEEAYLSALRAQLARRESVSEQDLVTLADARADAIVEYLTTKGIAADRILRSDSESTKKVIGGRVRLRMKLKSGEG